MRKPLCLAFTILLMITTIIACRQPHSYEFAALESIPADTTTINRGRDLKIIAYSGGQPSDKDNIYYHQFITIDEKTSDTFKVISALICVDSAGSVNGTYAPVSQFNPTKGILNVSLEKQDSTHQFLLKTITLTDDQHTGPGLDLNKPLTAKQVVTLNKSLDIFSKPYKTYIGILHFKEQPW
ncbi:MAG TPA: hypothetical protein VD996_08250 [Chitinophagaceae bacterium]|nr:hypothetical protein [Chitinophagaceae bacterium]